MIFSLRHFCTLLLTGLLLLGAFPGMAHAQGAPPHRPLPVPVIELGSTLKDSGCHIIAVSDSSTLDAAHRRGWHLFIPSDAKGTTLAACPSAVAPRVATYEARNAPQVAGVLDGIPVAQAQANNNILRENIQRMSGGRPVAALVDDAGLFDKFATFIGADRIGAKVIEILAKVFSTISSASYEIVRLAAVAIVPLLSQGRFLNNEFVQLLWPIVLGITNLGFMIALLLIALTTTLRLDIGGGPRRLLPRLLIAALLVNFSLVIAVLLLDFSRFLMAVLATVMLSGTGRTLVDLPLLIFEALRIPAFQASMKDLISEYGSIRAASMTLLELVLALFMVIPMLVVTFGLVVRYVMLMLLLVASPTAYLFAIFPNTSSLSRRWWSSFFRYLIYGPTVLFILLAIPSIPNIVTPTFQGFLTAAGHPEVLQIINYVMIGVMLYFAAVTGRFAGVLGSAAIIRVATRANQRVGRGVRRGVVGGVRAAGSGAYVGTGARAATRQARDFGRTTGQNLRRTIGFAERDSKGVPTKKNAQTLGTRAAGLVPFVGRGLSVQQRREANATRSYRIAGADNKAKAQHIKDSPLLTPTQLRKPHVGTSLGKDERSEIITNPEVDRARKVALVSNHKAVDAMDDSERSAIENLNINLDVDLPTQVGPGISQQKADDNREQNRTNKRQNEVNKAIQSAFYKSLDKIESEKNK